MATDYEGKLWTLKPLYRALRRCLWQIRAVPTGNFTAIKKVRRKSIRPNELSNKYGKMAFSSLRREIFHEVPAPSAIRTMGKYQKCNTNGVNILLYAPII